MQPKMAGLKTALKASFCIPKKPYRKGKPLEPQGETETIGRGLE